MRVITISVTSGAILEPFCGQVLLQEHQKHAQAFSNVFRLPINCRPMIFFAPRRNRAHPHSVTLDSLQSAQRSTGPGLHDGVRFILGAGRQAGMRVKHAAGRGGENGDFIVLQALAAESDATDAPGLLFKAPPHPGEGGAAAVIGGFVDAVSS